MRTISHVSIRSHREPTTLPVTDKTHHVFFPFFGAADDRAALRFVLQLVKNKNVTATVVHFSWSSYEPSEITPEVAGAGSNQIGPKGRPRQRGRPCTTKLRPRTWLSSPRCDPDPLANPPARSTLSRFNATAAAAALSDTSRLAGKAVGQNPNNAGDIVVVGRCHARLGDSAAESSGNDFKRTVGALADHLVSTAPNASLLISTTPLADAHNRNQPLPRKP